MADQIPETLFEQIYRRAPNQTDKDRLLGVKAGLGLSARDELWPILLTLDYYTATNQRARGEILKGLADLPDQVRSVVATTETAAARKADAAVAEAVAQGAEKLTQIVVQRSERTADRISKRQFLTAAIVGGVIVLFCLGAGATGAYVTIKTQFGICASEILIANNNRRVCYIE